MADQLRAIVGLTAAAERAADLGELAPILTRHCPPESAPLRAIIQYRAAPALGRVTADPAALTHLLHSLEPAARHAYLVAAGDVIRGRRPGAVDQAATLWLLGSQLTDPAAVAAIVEVLSWAVTPWGAKDLEQIANRLATVDGQAADEFSHQARLLQRGLAPRLMSAFSRLGGRRGHGRGD